MKKLWSVLVPAVCAIAVCVTFRFVLIIGYVPSASMEPTLMEGSVILGTRIYTEPISGDIIIFEHDGKLLVKRIAAAGGERIGNNIVPDGCYYVLGDNRDNSYDSRFWKEPYIRNEDIKAKVLFKR